METDFGHIAYDAYRDHMWTQKEQILDWSDLRQSQRDSWRMAAFIVRECKPRDE